MKTERKFVAIRRVVLSERSACICCLRVSPCRLHVVLPLLWSRCSLPSSFVGPLVVLTVNQNNYNNTTTQKTHTKREKETKGTHTGKRIERESYTPLDFSFCVRVSLRFFDFSRVSSTVHCALCVLSNPPQLNNHQLQPIQPTPCDYGGDNAAL